MVKVRLGAELFPIKRGDVIACRPGRPETARQIINASVDELKYLAVSTTMSPETAEYPDSDKTAVIMELDNDGSGMPNMWRRMMKNESTHVDYRGDEDSVWSSFDRESDCCLSRFSK